MKGVEKESKRTGGVKSGKGQKENIERTKGKKGTTGLKEGGTEGSKEKGKGSRRVHHKTLSHTPNHTSAKCVLSVRVLIAESLYCLQCPFSLEALLW